MPPRSKPPKFEWFKCLNCDVTFSSRDQKNHALICTEDNPFTVEQGLASKLQHGFIVRDTLIGVVSTSMVAPEQLPKSQHAELVLLHPSTLRLLALCIGQRVIVNHTLSLIAWPGDAASMPLAHVGVNSDTAIAAQNIGFEDGKAAIVYDFTMPVLRAAEVHLSCSDDHEFFITEDFSKYCVRRLNKKQFTTSNTVSINYFGKICSLIVTKTVDEHGNSDELEDEILKKFEKMTIKPSSQKDKSLNSIEKQTRQFVEISLQTQLCVNPKKVTVRDPAESKIAFLDQIGGLDDHISTIREMMNIAQENTLPQRLSAFRIPTQKGVLVYGPSGCGKSMLVKAVAESSGWFTVTINGPDIWSRFYGESEAKLVGFFKLARQRSPSVIVIDDIDTLCPRRDKSNNEVEKRVVASLLTLMDDAMLSGDRIFLLAATSKRDDLDPALRRPGRLDQEIDLGVPNAKQREQILQKQLHGVSTSLKPGDITEVANNAHGFTGADLAAVCKQAVLHTVRMQEGGKVLVTRPDLIHGLNNVQPSAMREVALQVPKVLWSDIGGQHELKHKLKQAIEWPLKHPEAFKRLGIRPPRGLLMYGPPGCSKTMIAKALARESGLNFLAIKGPELFSKWVGESERAVREVFRKARGAAPAIIFFDEIDALAGERGSGGGGGGGEVSDRVLAQLLTEIDGVDALKDVTIVAATNRPDRIDKALLRPGRLDRIVYVPLPDAPTRREIFSIHFKSMPVAEDVVLETLVDKTHRYSGAEVSAVCHEAALYAMQEDVDISRVHHRHFLQALSTVTPRITEKLITFYDNYAQSSGLHSV